MTKAASALAALSLVAASGPALAATCHDAHGKFIKCPPKPAVCHDAKGKFVKCASLKPKVCRNAQGHFAKC